MAAMRVNMPWYDSDPDTNAENTVTIDACMPQLAIFAKPKAGKPRVTIRVIITRWRMKNTVHNVVITSKSRKEVEKNTAFKIKRYNPNTNSRKENRALYCPLLILIELLDAFFGAASISPGY